VAIGDVNNDGLPDAIVGDLNGGLYYHRNTGEGFVEESSYLQSVALGDWSCPRLIDMDNDDDLDIVAGNENGNLFYFSNEGTADEPDWQEVPGYFGSIDVGMNCVPTLGDVDFDGDPDLLCGNISGNLKYYENTGENWVLNSETFMGISGGQNTAPALADLDGDGDVDLTLGQYSGIFNYFENQNPTTGIEGKNNSMNSWMSVYPNPANNIISLEFPHELNRNVEIRILDLSGRLMMQPIHLYKIGRQMKMDLDISKIPTGVYFIQLNGQQFSTTRKFVKR